MNQPAKISTLSLVVGCFAILLTIGNGALAYFRHQDAVRELAELRKQHDDLKEFIREVSSPTLVALEKKEDASARKLEEVIRAAHGDIETLRRELLEEIKRTRAGEDAALKAVMDIHNAAVKRADEARQEDMQHNRQERMLLRGEIMDELRRHILSPHHQ